MQNWKYPFNFGMVPFKSYFRTFSTKEILFRDLPNCSVIVEIQFTKKKEIKIKNKNCRNVFISTCVRSSFLFIHIYYEYMYAAQSSHLGWNLILIFLSKMLPLQIQCKSDFAAYISLKFSQKIKSANDIHTNIYSSAINKHIYAFDFLHFFL